jgi:hypothetical protein
MSPAVQNLKQAPWQTSKLRDQGQVGSRLFNTAELNPLRLTSRHKAQNQHQWSDISSTGYQLEFKPSGQAELTPRSS